MRHRCHNDECDYCEGLAEERANPPESRNDWQLGTDRYERELDARWER